MGPLSLRHTYPFYLINGTIFEKRVSEYEMCILSLLKLLFETFLILRRIQRDIAINVKTHSCKVRVILVGF
jgi:hypothetical protein